MASWSALGQIRNLRMCDRGVSRNGAEGRTTERAQGSMGARADPEAGALGLQILTRSPLSLFWCEWVCSSAGNTTGCEGPRPVWLQPQTLIVPKLQRLEVQCLCVVRAASVRGPHPWCAVFSPHPLAGVLPFMSVSRISLFRTPVLLDQGPPYWPHFTFITFWKIVSQVKSHSVYWGSGLQHMNWVGTQFGP